MGFHTFRCCRQHVPCVKSAPPPTYPSTRPGITTNPVILEKDNQRCTLSNLTKLCELGQGLGVKEMQFQVGLQHRSVPCCPHLREDMAHAFLCRRLRSTNKATDGFTTSQSMAELYSVLLPLPQAWGETCQQMVSVALDLYGINPQLVVVSHQRGACVHVNLGVPKACAMLSLLVCAGAFTVWQHGVKQRGSCGCVHGWYLRACVGRVCLGWLGLYGVRPWQRASPGTVSTRSWLLRVRDMYPGACVRFHKRCEDWQGVLRSLYCLRALDEATPTRISWYGVKRGSLGLSVRSRGGQRLRGQEGCGQGGMGTSGGCAQSWWRPGPGGLGRCCKAAITCLQMRYAAVALAPCEERLCKGASGQAGAWECKHPQPLGWRCIAGAH